MLENSVFYVASPEACAAILWKTSQEAPKAAEKLKNTATKLCNLKIADGIIPVRQPFSYVNDHESHGGICSLQIFAFCCVIQKLGGMDKDSLLNMRHMKFWVLWEICGR
ncbi:unnamed protein product [Musa hybrid cultivar]